jgi:DNA-directed RNA polymerase specialized sigma24 family protein
MTITRDPGQIDEDRGLLAAARLGDERAFGRLIEHHRRGLELYCELMLGCPDRAHEAVYETLLRGWRELDHVDPHASARIWLYRLATGICLEDLNRTD